ncbi:ribonuclease Y [Patescibacteria group bacterium]
MSFLKRFSTIVSGAKSPKTRKPKKAVQPVKKPQPIISKTQVLEAQAKARELIVEAKDQAFEIKKRADQNAQKIITESQNLKNKALEQTTQINHRLGAVEQREKSVLGKEKGLQTKLKNIEDLKQQQLKKIEAISKLKRQEAKDLIIKAYEKRMTQEIAEIIRQAEEKAKAEAEEKAKDILIESMRHGATDYVAEYTVSLVKVSDDDMKGRVIGREGRNIRTFEKATGVEVDLDEPGIIRLSCFDSIRREIARVALEKLLKDGRIQPTRIEEVVKTTKKELERIMHQEGEKLCHAVKVFNLPVEIVDMLGRFKYRFSYGQSMITHTLEETKIGIKLAHETGADTNIVKLGCLLHDIGKVMQDEEGTHVELGVKFLKKFNIPKAVIDCVAEHHEDRPFSSKESTLVYIADAISGSRPGARYEDHEGYLERMTQLEEISTSFDGVEGAYAIQAGREVRVIVNPKETDDDSAVKLASDIKDKIQENVKNFPGQIKITVIRETRSEAIAK